MQTIINPLVVSIGPTSETTITPVPMTHHGGGLKKLVAVVVAVAIPIAAPIIASSLVASTAIGAAVTATIGATATAAVSSAIVGAGLGAVAAKVTGGDVKAGAISGLIGGGISGYMSAAKPGMFGNPAANASTSTTATTLDGSAIGSGNTGNLPPGVQNAAYTPGGEASGSLSNTAMGGASGVAKGAADTAAALEGGTGFLANMKAGLSSAGQLVASKLTNPETLANAVLQVGGAVAAEAIVGTPADQSAETLEAIEQYKAELTALKAKDEAAFNQKMEAAKQYMVQAGYYDPNYFGLQAANKAAITEGRKLREFERQAGLKEGGVSSGDRRRAALSGSANVQSAFDRGFLSGVDLQNKATSTGVGLIPSASTNAANAQLGLANFYAGQDSASQASAQAKKDNIQKFFGSFAVNRGKTDAEKAKDAKTVAGLSTSSMPQMDNNIPGVVTPKELEKKKNQFGSIAV